jgi:methylenetetrahydrofolate reductase (NADPH)
MTAKATDIMKERMALSFELFPPKTEAGMDALCGAGGVLDKLCGLGPDYISVTYGAGGSNAGANLDVLKKVKEHDGVLPVSHFTCIGNTREDITEKLTAYLDAGIDHLLALRGDLPHGWTGTGGDFRYATELVEFIRMKFADKFTIAVAGSPEGHVAAENLDADIAHLKRKQEEGADFIMTQLCWDMDAFRRWMDKIRKAGITLPVDVGIMPVLDARSTINMALSRNACVLPRPLAELISRHWTFPDPFTAAAEPDDAKTDADYHRKKADFKEAGIEYTIKLIEEFKKCDISGIHIYALNKFEDAARILQPVIA